ncbi:hypothetical protein CCHL11_05486 [Colletotrichum chlorophyti]|uniref:Uncharacterized protein n=1 Tax=Colletotrichum chlorophyti TaxID=708187 RepID=A0A1Q8RB59_9PEZI|nr:hypothetical protein CCHL11_05486 [Colletotrichum chlorophyti]
MPGNDTSDNFFVRFKQKVDGHIASALQSVLGLPTAVTRNLNGRWPEHPKSHDNERLTADGNAGVQPRAPSSQNPQVPSVFELFSSMSPMQALFRAEEFTESLYQVMWISFLIDSSYSPLRLRDMPQPTPRDLPDGADPSLFGFEDAFEDLLMASSGQGLMDINERHRIKKEWRDSFPDGLPPILWLHQLTRQGLWDGWDPRPEVLEGAVSERWRRWLQEQNDPFHERRSLPAPQDRNPAKEVEKTARDEVQRQATPTRVQQDQHHGETEEDSYFSVMGKARLSGSKESTETKTSSTTSYLSSQGLPPGWRVVEKVQEREDANGNVKITRTVTTFDDKGEEVGRQTERRSEYAWSTSFSTGNGGKKGDQQERPDSDARDDEKGSWFWK